jgi:LemA family
MGPVLLIVFVVVAIVIAAAVLMYNGLVRQRNVVDQAWAQVDVQLKRRHDLIPNLVNAVKGAATSSRPSRPRPRRRPYGSAENATPYGLRAWRGRGAS